MADDLSYTDAEFAALQAAVGAHGGSLTRAMLEEYEGPKLTPDSLVLLFSSSDEVVDPFENQPDEDEGPSGKGGRQYEETSGWLKLNMRIGWALQHDEEPLGVPLEMVSQEQWEAAIGGRIGPNLIRYIAGISAERGAHFLSAQALIKRQERRADKPINAEITEEQLNELMDQKIMDPEVAFKPLVRFLYAAHDLRKEDVAKVTRSESISLLLADSNIRIRWAYVAGAAALLLADKETNPEHHGMFWQKVRAADRESGIDRDEPLFQRSNRLVEALWGSVKLALAQYESGGPKQSELPRAAEIMKLMDQLQEGEQESPLQHLFKAKFDASRQMNVFYQKGAIREKEWAFFKERLGLDDEQIALLKRLPFNKDLKLNYPHPDYILNHPEQRKTFGGLLKALREASGMALEDVGKILGVSKQKVQQTEAKKAGAPFRTRRDKTPVPDQYLNADPYGIFPKDLDGKVTQEFRDLFWALAQPNAMKVQYEEAKNWITQQELLGELGLKATRLMHQTVLARWHVATQHIRAHDEGEIRLTDDVSLNVKRDQDGVLRFHKDAVEILNKHPEIIDHLNHQRGKSQNMLR